MVYISLASSLDNICVIIKDPNQKIRKSFLSLKTQVLALLSLNYRVPLTGEAEEMRKLKVARMNPWLQYCHVLVW